ncbi:MAG: hypothetical protein M1825_006330 [Sarcosagium campestre]|nr:MAG: hypothetical protein M1825_006330 [Sarcosagium campestre]
MARAEKKRQRNEGREDPGTDSISTTLHKNSQEEVIRPTKKQKLVLDEEDSEDDNASEASSHEPQETILKINDEYARRFEHNKKREETHRLEEKYGKSSANGHNPGNGVETGGADSDDSSSTSEDEDDDGFLATKDLDEEIFATLNAIKSKDPRVYNKDVTFYKPIDDDDKTLQNTKKEKPMFLKDYHRKNLLDGYTGEQDEESKSPHRTFAEEQDDLKREIVKEMHSKKPSQGTATNGEEDSSDEGEDFLVTKSNPMTGGPKQAHPAPAATVPDPATAEKDPDSFLSNFMAARAWVPSDGARFQPLESDEDEEEQRADEFEQAYNLRFEDPSAANEKLTTHARDAVAKYTVRREDVSVRKKARDKERERKDSERQERREEKARLRRLKIEDAERKVERIKEAAGLRGKEAGPQDWADFLNANWDDERWDDEMNKRFGDAYYAKTEADAGEDGPSSSKGHKTKLKKPKWEDDIDITDLVPDFKDDVVEKRPFSLSDIEDDASEDPGEDAAKPNRHPNKAKKQERQDRKRAFREEKKRIADMVDENLDLDDLPHAPIAKRPVRFRYRETSPLAFGMTAKDILTASDSQLNQYAGLKKLASYRDPDKKRRDKKRLGKKARLRQWRKETFGDEAA